MSSSTDPSLPQSSFDFSPMLQTERYHNLETNADKMRFTFMVRDYMIYARSLPINHVLTDVEEAAAMAFANGVTSEEAWPLAQQTAPELRGPLASDDLNQLPALLRPAIKAALDAGHLQVRQVEISSAQRFEEDLMWQNLQAQIRYIGYYAGRLEMTPPARRQEVEDTIALLGSIVRRVGLPDDTLDEREGLDLEQDDVSEVQRRPA